MSHNYWTSFLSYDFLLFDFFHFKELLQPLLIPRSCVQWGNTGEKGLPLPTVTLIFSKILLGTCYVYREFIFMNIVTYHPLLFLGIGYSGASFGTLILPVVYAVLIEEYTVRGALLFAGQYFKQLLAEVFGVIFDVIA